MSYKAIIARIHVTPIEGAKTLVQGKVLGYEVAVDKSTVDGSLGIFFPTDGQLSEEFATANDLVSRGTDPVTGEKLGGYFSSSRRVTTQKFMKGAIRSEGFFCPLSYLDFTLPTKGVQQTYAEGYEFDTFNGVPICNKYYTPATLAAMKRDERKGVPRLSFKGFDEHVETSHWQRFNKAMIPVGTRYTITEKLHGTSGRAGKLSVTRRLKWWQKFANFFGNWYPATFDKFLVGSRRVVLNDRMDSNEDGWRFKSVEFIRAFAPRGVVFYFELIGHEPSGKPIMADVDPIKVGDKTFTKKFTNMPNGMMRFKYGAFEKEARVVLYRVTENGKDLPDSSVRTLAGGYGFTRAPKFTSGIITDEESISKLEADVAFHTDGPSMLDESHIREGVVIRLDYPDGTVKFLKNKSINFGILEGYLKSSDTYVDTEESA